MEHLRTEFFKDRVFVSTPDGDVIDLPEESSPIDFAYVIHTGYRQPPLRGKNKRKDGIVDTKLKTGDIIEIVTKRRAPNHEMACYAKTALAKNRFAPKRRMKDSP